MFLFILSLLLSFNVETYSIDNDTYILFSSDENSVSFSSFRLKNPDRIVLELDTDSLGKIKIPEGSLIQNVDIRDKNGKVRILFDIKTGSFYQILNRDNMLLLGVGAAVFNENSNFESVYAKVQIEKEQKERLVSAQPEKKNGEEALVGELLAKEEKIKREKEEKLYAELKRQEEEKRRENELRRIAQIKEESRLAELKREEEEKRALAERKRIEEEEKARKLAELNRLEEEKRALQERKRIEEEEKARKLAELNRLEEEKRALQEKKRVEEEEKARKLAELNRLEEEKRALQEKKRVEEEEKARKLAELNRLEEEKRALQEKKRVEEEEKARKLAELNRLEEEKRALQEKKRIEEEEKARKLAELNRLEEEKRALQEKKRIEEEKRRLDEEKRLALQKNSSENALKSVAVVNENGKNIELPVKRKISDNAPLLPVVKMRDSGTLKNLYFRKFPEFSRVTLDLTGEVDYRFREINGGYVIDIYNMKKIPKHLLYIIDARAFNSVVKYIYPQKKDGIFKIYIKTDENLAVRKSSEGSMVNFDFYIPQLN